MWLHLVLIKGSRGAVWECVETWLCFVHVELEVMVGHPHKDTLSSHMHMMGAGRRVNWESEGVGIIHMRQQSMVSTDGSEVSSGLHSPGHLP